MKLIALEHEQPDARPLDYTPDLLAAEARRVYELQQAGVIREIHFRADRNEAVLILECNSLDDARTALDTLPLAQAGLITFEIIPLKPYPGLARLFMGDDA